MFFVEPPQSPYDLRFSFAGVPIRVHPWFWVMTVILAMGRDGDPGRIAMWVLAVFSCVLIHELGHVAAFRFYGQDAHVVLHSFGGLAIPTGGSFTGRSGGFGRRRGYGESWLADVVVSFAGPAAGFLFAAVIYVGLVASGRHPEFYFSQDRLIGLSWDPFSAENVNWLIYYAQFINIFWGLVNLLPIYPLDGGQISRAVLNQLTPADGLRNSLALSALAATGMAAVMLVRWHSFYGAIFFGYMAFNSFQAFQQVAGRGRW